ncbi:hypothetical protein BD410DRAFT_791815 [Rickenella mellea]|uniref:Uncharacterized protein n=1 Tax=Rickenella mellea TaxID=50990 RepID=A0A4Y7PYL0_9AGAM|nr:hypothetical protein BD410DRAFT_791815 [Rickenella mellea]
MAAGAGRVRATLAQLFLPWFLRVEVMLEWCESSQKPFFTDPDVWLEIFKVPSFISSRSVLHVARPRFPLHPSFS